MYKALPGRLCSELPGSDEKIFKNLPIPCALRMLRITPYIPFIIPIVLIGGLFSPLFGYVLLLDMLLLIAISLFRGRFFCGNLCSRGLFNDFVLKKISRKAKIPSLFFSMKFRIIVLAAMMSFMVYRIFQAQGIIHKIGSVLLSMYIMQTLVISIIAVTVSPRAWCHICPAGTIQRLLGGDRKALKSDRARCIKCGICNKVCPMSLPVNEIISHPGLHQVRQVR